MNAHATVLEKDATQTTAVAVITEQNALTVLTDPKKFDSFYERVKAETDAFVPDLSTDAGRKAIAAMAFKVTKTKTAIDAARKTLTEDARKQVEAANAAGRVIWDRLEALAAEVRKPLTEWELAEKARVAECEGVLNLLREAAVVRVGDTAESVGARLAEVEATVIDPARFMELAELAANSRETALNTLRAAAERIAQEERDRAELERLRQAEAARLAAEAEEREAKARAEAAEVAAKIAAEAAEHQRLDEIARLERAKAEAEKAAQAAAEAATRAAEERAKAEQEAREREHADALAAERRRADEAEAARKAEAEAAAKAAADAQAAADAARQAEEARAADRAHRGEIMGAAKAAIMAVAAVSEDKAREIVLAIAANEIPAVSIRF